MKFLSDDSTHMIDNVLHDVLDDADAAFLLETTQLDLSIRESGRKLPNPNLESLLECEKCGAEIPEARRTALKGVRICVDCANEIEQHSKRFGSPYSVYGFD